MFVGCGCIAITIKSELQTTLACKVQSTGAHCYTEQNSHKVAMLTFLTVEAVPCVSALGYVAGA